MKNFLFFISECLTCTNVSLLSKFVKQVGLVQVHSVAEIYKVSTNKTYCIQQHEIQECEKKI